MKLEAIELNVGERNGTGIVLEQRQPIIRCGHGMVFFLFLLVLLSQ
jgi:hypothetical protein